MKKVRGNKSLIIFLENRQDINILNDMVRKFGINHIESRELYRKPDDFYIRINDNHTMMRYGGKLKLGINQGINGFNYDKIYSIHELDIIENIIKYGDNIPNYKPKKITKDV